MKYVFTFLLILLYSGLLSQSFVITSKASEGKKMIISVLVKDFKYTSGDYDKIVQHGDSLYETFPDKNMMALYFTKNEFNFSTYQESVDLFNSYLLNRYEYYNNICVAMYKQGAITLRPFKYFNDKRFNN